MAIVIQHEYAGSIYNSAGEANKAAVQDMMTDVDIDNLDHEGIVELANELLAQGFELPVFDTDQDALVSIIEEVADDHYYEEA